jgi:hypothetical protein
VYAEETGAAQLSHAPLGEPGAGLVVRLAPLVQVVDALRHGLAVLPPQRKTRSPDQAQEVHGQAHSPDQARGARSCTQPAERCSRARQRRGGGSREVLGGGAGKGWVAKRTAPAMGTTPLSTLMPTTMPLDRSRSTKDVPSAVLWYSVSSYMITPLMVSSRPARVAHADTRTRQGYSEKKLQVPSPRTRPGCQDQDRTAPTSELPASTEIASPLTEAHVPRLASPHNPCVQGKGMERGERRRREGGEEGRRGRRREERGASTCAHKHTHTRGGEQDLTVQAAVLLRVLYADGVKPLANGANRLVGSKNALAGEGDRVLRTSTQNSRSQASTYKHERRGTQGRAQSNGEGQGGTRTGETPPRGMH